MSPLTVRLPRYTKIIFQISFSYFVEHDSSTCCSHFFINNFSFFSDILSKKPFKPIYQNIIRFFSQCYAPKDKYVITYSDHRNNLLEHYCLFSLFLNLFFFIIFSSYSFRMPKYIRSLPEKFVQHIHPTYRPLLKRWLAPAFVSFFFISEDAIVR